jgi:hypothetical protein
VQKKKSKTSSLPILHIEDLYSRVYCARDIAGRPEAEIDLIIASGQACLVVKYEEL